MLVPLGFSLKANMIYQTAGRSSVSLVMQIGHLQTLNLLKVLKNPWNIKAGIVRNGCL